MAEIVIVDQTNKEVGKRELNPAVFGLDADDGFVHRVYAALASAQRSGTRAVKGRADVSGGGKKPWKQKGTGRARQGSTRAAQWRHGGTAHGPSPLSDFATRINKKERRRALCLALSGCLRDGKLTVVDKLEFADVKTKSFVQTLNALGTDSGLVVLGEANRTVELSGRNVRDTSIVLDGQLNLHDLLKCKRVVMTAAAVDKLEERLA
ncbi:50S ribosomal protein L4 [Mariprofundus erugo]|uniref:Large ribosomal subunit protein uL4 n=1 Tax=Mariprofundus erugo TaxID=2528639 RepID=A0A5R9GHV9_9PROT|nr:50S ribosomal protein L4 [Mariprofundus erugo]TLS65518.1 50S ribosomal protein L4 [Mariprofundus erugo]TLS74076.1 50S ribosomal protein L4 [Mariprofundus erugo]